jgi:3-oxoacyl-[acyl-carrier protein] reductase
VDTDLAGRVVVITGAARGIGAATARAFAGEGARVVVNYRASSDRAEELAGSLPDAIAVQADIAQEDEVDRLFATAVERYGRVDVCVCNAAIYSPSAPAVDMRRVREQRSGNLILIGSTAGIYGEEGQADYAATKAALTGGLLPTLKNEIARLAPLGRVNAVCPGWTETEMAAPALSEPGALERITQTMPLRKVAQPDDVAWQVVVLASDRLSGHVSGQVVVVAGGMEGRLLHEA